MQTISDQSVSVKGCDKSLYDHIDRKDYLYFINAGMLNVHVFSINQLF